MDTTTPSETEVRDLAPDDHAEAVGVLARGMRDNPLHVAAFGDDPERRRRSLEQMFTGFLGVSDAQTPLEARRNGVIVGVAGIAPPGTCRPSFAQQLRVAPTIAALGLGPAIRLARWLKVWTDHDPSEPHSHLGPLAVDAHLQGQGIGSAIMADYCHRLDRAQTVGYLETDKPENVRFYERFGFEVVGEAKAIGVPNWFMRRSARSLSS